MSLNPRVCKKSYKVHIPMMGEACEFWLVRVTDIESIKDPDKDHAYLTDSGDFYVFDGTELRLVGFEHIYTTEQDIDEFVPNYATGGGDDPSVATNDYNDLLNKPSINDVVLQGNKTTDDLNIYETIDNSDVDSMFED